MLGTLSGYEGTHPTLEDFIDHSTTAFPEVRLKTYLELRSVDSLPLPYGMAFTALATGLLYCPEILQHLEDMVMAWPAKERSALWIGAPKQGLDILFQGKPLWDIAEYLVTMAMRSLKKRAIITQADNGQMVDETVYLKPLQRLLEDRMTIRQVIRQ